MRGVCQACSRIADMHECISCRSQVCLTCVGRDGCKACKNKPKK